jgi:adenine-specific DNA-methyltransferase
MSQTEAEWRTPLNPALPIAAKGSIATEWDPLADAVLFHGECLDLLKTMPAESAQLIVTSPPYNIGKRYERKRSLEAYLNDQAEVIEACERILKQGGSICWQVGNHLVGPQEVLPLDIALFPFFSDLGLKLRNRIIWHFEHGLHCTKRFSGRYETILWFTKGDHYTFNLDPVRIPQKYPGKKHYRGPNIGKYSSNPLGKNPGDLWTIPNVKHNHTEKTIHPCQFPVELIERLVLSMTHPGDLVFDPYMGVATAPVAAILHGRRGAGADTEREYVEVGKERVLQAIAGTLRTRPRDRGVYEPDARSALARRPPEFDLAAK